MIYSQKKVFSHSRTCLKELMISLINNLDCLSSSAAETSGAALGAGSMILKEYFLTELSGVSTCLASYGEGAGLYTGAVRR